MIIDKQAAVAIAKGKEVVQGLVKHLLFDELDVMLPAVTVTRYISGVLFLSKACFSGSSISSKQSIVSILDASVSKKAGIFIVI